MEELSWEIVVGIITLFGFVISIGKLISNNTKALTELQCSIDSLKKSLKRDENNLKVVEEKVDNHEIRITKLEVKED